MVLEYHWGPRVVALRSKSNQRGLALPSAAKGNNRHYQYKVIVCVSVISVHMPIGF